MSKRKRQPESVADLMSRRSPGLDGTYSGTCMKCMRPTDTTLAVRGEPEWHAAFLIILGLPKDEAMATVEMFSPPLDGQGRYEGFYRVCTKCAAKASKTLPKPVLALNGELVPMIAQP